MNIHNYGYDKYQSQYQISAKDRMGGYLTSFTFLPTLGLITADSTDKGHTMFQGMTALNFLGYIPGVSLITGIARIIFSQISEAFQNDYTQGEAAAIKEAQIVRGVTECLSVFGPALLIIDIVATIILLVASDD